MKVVLVAAVLLAVAHVGDAHDEAIPEVHFPVRFTQATYNVSEGVNSNTVITVESIQNHNFPFTVYVVTRDGSARAGSDFIRSNETVVFAAGENSRTVSLPVIIDDEVVELTENFTLCIDIEHDSYHLGVVDLDCAQVLISDTDIASASFGPQNYTIPEGTPAELTIRLDKVCTFDVVFTVTTMDMTAEDSSDYYGGTFPAKIDACDESMIQDCEKKTSVSVRTKRSSTTEVDEDFKATLALSPMLDNVNIEVDTAYVTILDTTVPVKFRAATYDVTEGQSTVELTLEAGVDPTNELTVYVVTQDRTALGGDDYRDGRYPVTFDALTATATVTVTIFDDEVAECLEEFSLGLEIPEGSVAITESPDSATVSIRDDEVPATISFSPQNYTVREGQPVNLSIVLDRPFSCAGKYPIVSTIDDSAKASSDYVKVNDSVHVPPGETTATQTVITKYNSLQETNEIFKAMLSLPDGLTSLQLGENTAYVTICDIAIVTINFSPQHYTVKEGDPVELIIALQEPSARSITFTVSTMDGTANYTDDYLNITETVTVEAGETEGKVQVKTQKNTLVEEDQHFKAMISTSDDCGNVVVGRVNTAFITINDTTVQVSFESNITVTEGVDSSAVVTLKTNNIHPPRTAFNVTVVANATRGNATRDSDYTGARFTVTFQPGQTTAMINVSILDDDVAECLEELTLELEIPEAAAALCVVKWSPDTARVWIKDNDVVRINFSSINYTVSEGSARDLMIVLDREAAEDIVFKAVTMGGNAAKGRDYIEGNYSTTIRPGETEARLHVLALRDNISNDAEYFKATLIPYQQSSCVQVEVDTDPAFVFITDTTVVVQFNSTQYTVPERYPAVTITLETKWTLNEDFQVEVHTEDGTAKHGSDYGGPEVIMVDFQAGKNSSTFSVPIINGSEIESPENFYLELRIPASTAEKGVARGGIYTARVKIIEVVTVSFSPQNYTVREGDEIYLMIKLEKESTKEITFTVKTMPDSAEPPDDYLPEVVPVTLSPGETETRVRVRTQRNILVEDNEHFKAIIIPCEGCDHVLVGVGTAFIKITDCTVLLSFSPETYTVTEETDSVDITLIADGAHADTAFNVTVDVDNMECEANVGESDFEGGKRIVTFQPGQKNATFRVLINDDDVVECPEKLVARIESISPHPTLCVAKGSPDTAHVDVLDDDVATISFSPQNSSVREGDPVNISIVLDRKVAGSITFTVNTTDITANKSSEDYAIVSNTVTIPAGERRASPLLLALRDNLIEEDEHFKATLTLHSTPFKVEVGPDPAFVAIKDTTVPVQFNPTMYTRTEGIDKFANVTLEATKDHDFPFEVELCTRDGSAELGPDYGGPEVIRVKFKAGVNKVVVPIPIIDDEIAECPENFSVELVIPKKTIGVAAVSGHTALIGINDNDGAEIYFDPQNYTVDEGSTVNLTVKLNITASKNITFRLDTMDITAVDPSDYKNGGQLTIPAGRTSVIWQVETFRDTSCETDEHFKAGLILHHSPVMVDVNPVQAFVTIRDKTVPVQLKQSVYTVKEGGSLDVTLEALVDHDFNFTVELNISDGTAKRGSDYDIPERTVTFPAEVNKMVVSIPILNNDIAECPEEFHLKLVVPQTATEMGVVAKSDDTAVVNIEDDDELTVQFSSQKYTVRGDNSPELMVTLNRRSAINITFTVSTMNLVPEYPSDYSGANIHRVIPTGMTKATISVPRNTAPSGTSADFKATLTLNGGCVNATVGVETAVVNVCNRTETVVLSFTEPTYEVWEGVHSHAVIGVQASGWHPGNPFSVKVIPMDDTAISPSDYNGTMFPVHFPFGPCTYLKKVRIMDDTTREPIEQFFLKLVIPPAAADMCVFMGTADTATVTIIDAVLVRFKQTTLSVTEGRQLEASIQLEVVGDPLDTAFNVTVIAKDGSAKRDSDYIGERFMVQFKPRETKATFYLPIHDDYVEESTEEFTLELEIPAESAALQVVKGQSAQVTVLDDDEFVVQVRFNPATYTITEGVNSYADITLVTHKPPTRSFYVWVNTRDGSALASSDYRRSYRGRVNFKAGERVATFKMDITNDLVAEDPEEFYLDLEIPPAATAIDVIKGSPDSATVRIADEDSPIRVEFNQTTYSVTEGVDSYAVITVEALGILTRSFSVYVHVRDSSAKANSDYRSSRRHTVSFTAARTVSSFKISISNDLVSESVEEFFLDLEIPSSALAAGAVKGSPDNVTVSITDDDMPIPVRFHPATYFVTEGVNSYAEITLEVTTTPSKSFSVYVNTQDGSAKAGSDYRRARNTVSFSATKTVSTFKVYISNDLVAESSEEFFLDLEIPSSAIAAGAIKGSPDSATVDITDEDLPIPVRFHPATYFVTEGTNSYAEITLEVTTPPSKSFYVYVNTRDGSAKAASDYRRARNTVSFSATKLVSTFKVYITNDLVAESSEDFFLDLEIPSSAIAAGAIKGSPDTATVEIANDDTPIQVRFNQTTYRVTEGVDSYAVITLEALAVPTRSFSVYVNVRSNSAKAGSDYSSSRRHTVSFTAARTVSSFKISIYNDLVSESVEEFFLDLEIPSNALAAGAVKGSPDNVTVSITDDDIPIPVRFNQTTYYVTEGENSYDLITLEALATPTRSFYVYVTTRDESAVASSDYRRSRTRVYFSATKLDSSFKIYISNDEVVESTEEFFLDLEIPSGAVATGVTKGSPDMAKVEIANDDVPVPVKFNQTTYHVAEGVDSYAVITLEALAIRTKSFYVWVTTQDGSADARFDYRSFRRVSVTFPPGKTSASLTVKIYDDLVAEGTEEFFLNLEIPPAAAAMGVHSASPDNATVRITDGDMPIRVVFSQATYHVTEGEDSYAEITMEALERIPTRSFSVYVNTRDGSAKAASDYRRARNTVSFSATKLVSTFKIYISDDLVAESPENFFLDLEIPSNALALGAIKGSPDSATVDITDEDTSIQVRFNQTTYYVTEGVNPYAVITLEALAVPTRSFYVYVNTQDGSAVASSDYRRSRSTVYFSATKLVSSFKIYITNDEVAESTEEFFLDLEIPSNAVAAGAIKASPDNVTVSIANDDIPVPVRFNQTTYHVAEGVDSYAVITLEALEIRTKSFYVWVNVRDGSAVAGSDYRSSKKHTVTFAAGKKVASFSIYIYNDQVAEPTEEFFLDLEIPAAADAIGVHKVSPDNATVYIGDDDVKNTVRFNQAKYNVMENSSYVDITLEARAIPTEPFFVIVTTRDGTAIANTDYNSSWISVSFSAGVNVASLSVDIIDDQEAERAEEFFLDLMIPPNAVAVGVIKESPDSATVCIEDDDTMAPVVMFKQDTYLVTEGVNSSAVITLETHQMHDFSFDVDVVARDGTAFAGSDYGGSRFTGTFPAGVNTASVSVDIINNPEVESNKEFFLDLEIPAAAAAMGVTKGPPDSATVTIVDENVEVKFAEVTYVIEENDGAGLYITLNARGNLSSAFTIRLRTNGLAEYDNDYELSHQSVTFPASVVREASETLKFLARCDHQTEGNENAVLTIITQDARVVTGNPASTEVVILDNCIPGPLRNSNDTVMSNPVFTVPIYNTTNNTQDSSSSPGWPMCYEVHGKNDTYFNLISDNCTSVNAFYVAAKDPAGNVIKVISVMATDNKAVCHYIRVEVKEGICVAHIDGQALLNNGTMIYGVNVKHKNSLVQIGVPNCGSPDERLVMWVHCQKLLIGNHEQSMIKYIINRGLRDRPKAHGLIGQFWGVPFTFQPEPGDNYTLTMHPPSGMNRTFFADVHNFTWTQQQIPAIIGRKCLFVGSSQAGPYPASSDSVIEGNWMDYITNGLFATDWTYNRYTASTCGIRDEK